MERLTGDSPRGAVVGELYPGPLARISVRKPICSPDGPHRLAGGRLKEWGSLGPGHLGVDLEDTGRNRMEIASKVLPEAELTEVRKLPPDCQWTDTVVRISIKEPIYKALAPTLKRYIAFKEAEVRPTLNGTAEITLRLDGELAPHSLEARYAWLEESVLATVRARFR